jgi:hypothetical protein
MAYPDILNLLRDRLATVHTPVPVVTRVPDSRPARFFQLRMVGGAATHPVRAVARFDVFTWSTTEETAAADALAVRLTMTNLAGTDDLGITCYRVEETLGPRQADDLVTGMFRWWATYALTCRADDAIQ